MFSYDHPLSERVRNLLRLEHLFARFKHTSAQDDKWSHHVALGALFEILESTAHANVKLEILQELERQRQQLVLQPALAECVPNLDERLQTAIQDLKELQQKFGQHIRESEWLMALKQRLLVPGGTTPVELPGYHFWQKQGSEQRKHDLQQWSRAMMPTAYAVSVLLEVLRANPNSIDALAEKGHYQGKSLAQNIHLLTIEIPVGREVLPEVSANKYFTHIRFLEAGQEHMRGKPATDDVPFKMIMCSFDSHWQS